MDCSAEPAERGVRLGKGPGRPVDNGGRVRCRRDGLRSEGPVRVPFRGPAAGPGAAAAPKRRFRVWASLDPIGDNSKKRANELENGRLDAHAPIDGRGEPARSTPRDRANAQVPLGPKQGAGPIFWSAKNQ